MTLRASKSSFRYPIVSSHGFRSSNLFSFTSFCFFVRASSRTAFLRAAIYVSDPVRGTSTYTSSQSSPCAAFRSDASLIRDSISDCFSR